MVVKARTGKDVVGATRFSTALMAGVSEMTSSYPGNEPLASRSNCAVDPYSSKIATSSRVVVVGAGKP